MYWLADVASAACASMQPLIDYDIVCRVNLHSSRPVHMYWLADVASAACASTQPFGTFTAAGQTYVASWLPALAGEEVVSMPPLHPGWRYFFGDAISYHS